ncbi:1,2-phenylacetyl-CoA epoxidase subunit PaaD [Hydrogenophaga sp. 5NK40-0174]|uniref:1,2-phenylacetyl-CoA epoxidase subunit PaaD n=1 Tax=Hydrogenophaga sp. 5NK40-0174 TaxID=3127649 RepID=UPI00310A6A07
MNQAATERCEQAWAALKLVPDPEVPAISLCELGIVRDVQVAEDGVLEAILTPTYSGCPATELIEEQALAALNAAGLGPSRIVLRRAPAWTTDWISEEGRQKLRAYGIAPPGRTASMLAAGEAPIHVYGRRSASAVPCPRCGSDRTEQLSPFGSTACKALHRCLSCLEPFEHFKPI